MFRIKTNSPGGRAYYMIITQQAKLIRLGVDKIRETGRSAQGVTLIKCGEDDLVTSASLLAMAEEDDE